MSTLRFILADQLSLSISSLEGLDKARDCVMLCEVMEEATHVPHHPKKIAFLFAAMRHFAAALEADGVKVHYVRLDDPANSGSFTGEVTRAVAELTPDRMIVTEPGEYRVGKMMRGWQESLDVPVEILPDTRFIASHREFAAWAAGRQELRMEFFYREMRRKTGLLMEADGKPCGGNWNFDKQNRKPPQAGMPIPKRISHPKSAVTRDVLALVKRRFSHHFGDLEPFHFAVTREQAVIELDHFINEVLPSFGDFQDAMIAGEPYMFHSLLSSYLNAGLLDPLEMCRRAEAAWRSEKAPINAVEGFIRQIIGWREYVRGIYWLLLPDYGTRNTLHATRSLPAFFWGAETGMACVAETVRHTREHAYSHHIQRLMITGNFALLAGLDVGQVQDWYLAVYSDAYEWVEMPNTLGMALYGDGGVVASKPYAASGKYIDRMSNYCASCRYEPGEMTGEKACPFNSLYWDFLVRHEKTFRTNRRMPYVFSTWEKFAPGKQSAILLQAADVLQRMERGTL